MIKQARPLIDELGPEHAGMRFTPDEFEAIPSRDGYRFELIDGVLNVVATPDPYAGDTAQSIADVLRQHRDAAGRRVFAHVKLESRVIIQDDPLRTTNPQPDVAAYTSYPPKPVRSFKGVNPALVVEVVTPGSVEKDFHRNVKLYADVPTILEYWVIDTTEDIARPSMAAFVRTDGGALFTRADVPAGGIYESVRWPGLRVDLSRIAVE